MPQAIGVWGLGSCGISNLHPALGLTKIETEITMSSKSQKQVGSEIGPAFTQQPSESARGTSRQRRKQPSVASPVLHHSIYNSSAEDHHAAAARKR
ncbi:hypothetical protein AVEN_136524-1 [Araneus ventricosus]|uniref:Uncharacterized protein n=1 Tax=Araneus ventricosus TaxID=182803 RepID=A0A4Y2KLI3_ARAVE|nr:hypothetical protein AVEN_136524-1 [Araneus ventricosus]